MALYFFSSLPDALKRRLSEAFSAPTREADPIDHPDIAAMNLAELADLPLWPDRGLRPAAESVDQPELTAIPAPRVSPMRLPDHGVVRRPAA